MILKDNPHEIAGNIKTGFPNSYRFIPQKDLFWIRYQPLFNTGPHHFPYFWNFRNGDARLPQSLRWDGHLAQSQFFYL